MTGGLRWAAPACAAAVLLAALGAEAQPLPLPEGVPATADGRGQCYLPGEKRQLKAAIDAQRVTLGSCPDPVVPPDATVKSFRVYKKGSNTVVDCASLRANDASSAYLDIFLKDLVAAMEDGGTACAGAMVGSWAEAGAMEAISEEGSPNQARLDRTWTFAGISAGYFSHGAVQAAARAAGTDAAVLAWFQDIAGQIAGEIALAKAEDRENNTQYWRAFAVLPTALLTGDAALLKAARGVFDRALDASSTRPGREGFLPKELKRGDKALHYQIFAARPLVAMALMSEAYGCGFLNGDGPRARLAAILARAVEGESDPGVYEAEIARRSGKDVAQQTARGNSPGLLYLAEAADPGLHDLIVAQVSRDLGAAPKSAKEIRPTEGQDRLGGAYADFAATVATLRALPPPPGLAGTCGG